MKRSHLKSGDVLLSIVGSIGEASLVAANTSATCSCKLAILRPRAIAGEYLATYIRSEFGRSQTERYTRGAIQKGLLLEDMDQIKIARPSNKLEKEICGLVSAAKKYFEQTIEFTAKIEIVLANQLKLVGWQPPLPPSDIRRASSAFISGRLDAEHWQEFYFALTEKLKKYPGGSLQLGDICPNPVNGVEIREYVDQGVPYLRVGDLVDFTVNKDSLKFVLPASAAEEIEKVRLEVGDVLVSRSGSLAVTGVIEQGWEHSVISSHLIRLRISDKDFDPYYVAAFLAAMPGKMQIQQQSNGGVQPEINQPSLKRITIPRLEPKQQQKVKEAIKAAHKTRDLGNELLEKAKRAVEIAIEQSETAALNYLKGN